MAETASVGFAIFLQCNKREAIQEFSKHLEYYPNDYDSLLYRGISHGILQDETSAISDFTEAAKYGSQCQKMVADAHRLLYEGKTEDAISTIHQVTQRFPSDPIGWHFYGSFRRSSNICDDATIAAFEKAIELKFPQAALSHYYVGEMMVSENNHYGVVKHMEEAVKLNPTFALAYVQLWKVLTKLNREEDASRYFEKALKLNKPLTQAHAPQACQQLDTAKSACATAAAGGMKGGGGGNDSGGSDGDSSDGDGGGNDDKHRIAGKIWKKIASIAKKAGQLYRKDNRTYVRTKLDIDGTGEKDILISKDTAKHGGAYFKAYSVTNRRATFIGSLDENMKLMQGKHESQAGTSFLLKELKQLS